MIDKDEYLTCCYCGEHKKLNDFNKSNSDLYVATGVLPICKKCLKKVYNFYNDKFMNPRLAMQRICSAFDLYYNDSIYHAADSEDSGTMLTNYIKMLNTAQYKGRTFNNTLIEGFAFSPEDQADMVDAMIKPDDVRMWGKGFTVEDYETLNDHYQLLKKSNENLASNQIIYISDLCKTHLLKCRALENGDYKAYNDCSTQYMKLFKEAGLSLKAVDTLGDRDTWGTMIERVQQYTPSEYYKNKKLYTDYDKFGDYMQRFVFRPIKNLITGEDERDPEFTIEDVDGKD